MASPHFPAFAGVDTPRAGWVIVSFYSTSPGANGSPL